MSLVVDRVKIIYTPGLKGSLISRDNLPGAITILQRDLLALKVPHPPRTSISIIKTGTIEFYWNTKKGGTLDIVLNQRLRNPANNPEIRESLRELLIQDVELKSTPVPSQPNSRRHSKSSLNAGEPSSSTPAEKRLVSIPDRTERGPEKKTELQRQAQALLDDIGETIVKTEPSSPNSESLNLLNSSSSRTIRPTQIHNAPHPTQPRPPMQEDVKPSLGQLTVNGLLSELKEIRQQLEAQTRRERAIIEELKRHNAMPDPSTSGVYVTGNELGARSSQLTAHES
ncbi:hypothetical protein V5O48_002428 [Marasmius crinis-equi]|uniref:Uncharacterized protein n=1 Tax=Marasmius crinis-equi TaxID=585013 RepID=A0ABR3FVR4_9AGAR